MEPAEFRIERLPRVDAGELELVCEVERYDGPIAGILRRGREIFWFEWQQDAAPKDATPEEQECRVFSLHPVLPDRFPEVEAWVRRYESLLDEYRLIANPYYYPMNRRQRASLRPLETVEAELARHEERRPCLEAAPPVAWFLGTDTRFAAIDTFYLERDRARDFEKWQIDVAQALAAEDQPALDRLFAAPPVPCDPLDIFFIHRPGGTDPFDCIVRDWRGRPLPEDFLMTAKHRVQCFDNLVKR